MSIKATFPAGLTELTVNGLHQWNYGQQLEIEAVGLPAMVEVHFACSGMETAVVRSCAVVDGKTTAAIPDRCLEQTTPVVAWVYAIGETSGETILTVKMPIIARAQPQLSPTVPEDVSDKYTEAVAAMNELVAACEQTLAQSRVAIKAELQQEINSGALAVGEADHADKADEAAVLNPDASIGGRGDELIEITSHGIYIVTFYTLDGYNTSVISITDFTKHARGAVCRCAPPDGSASDTDNAMPYYNADSGRLSVYHPKASTYRMPILCVHKIAGF